MRKAIPLRLSAILMAFLVVSLPIIFAEELNLVYDKNGNLVSGDGSYRIYNSLNQLWKIHNGTSEARRLLEEFIYHPTEEIPQSLHSFLCFQYSTTIGISEMRIITTITALKLSFTNGMFPKKYPPNTNNPTQSTPPMIL